MRQTTTCMGVSEYTGNWLDKNGVGQINIAEWTHMLLDRGLKDNDYSLLDYLLIRDYT